MNASDLNGELERLMADTRLVELCQLERTGDEVLDVISLSENQHSDILAWLLDSREGHGQGDEILRDLLVCASSIASSDSSELDPDGQTARFFALWTPSRLRTTSLGSAFIARELGMSAKERVDLFVIDTQNRYVLLIENKAGARHTKSQLNGYRKSFDEAVSTNPRLSDYSRAHIALDRDTDGDDRSLRASADQWLHLGYDWLKVSAKRALLDVERGNAAARLVVSYCNRQTDWESPLDERCISLASQLHRDYPNATKYLLEDLRGDGERATRLEKALLEGGNKNPSHLLFLLQNKGAVDWLRETRGMASLGCLLQESIKDLSPDNIYGRKKVLDICPTGCEVLGPHEWPVYFRVSFSGKSQSTYTLSICWHAKSAKSPTEAQDLRRRLSIQFPQFEKHEASGWRQVRISHNLGISNLVTELAKLNSSVSESLLAHNHLS